jgi:NADPH:quinone reductase
MRALLCESPCDWDELSVQDVAEPAMIADGVRIAVQAASVSFAMSLQVAGTYQRHYPLPFIPGTEVGGRVLEVAPGVTDIQVGDQVLAIIDWGGLAQQVVTRKHTVYPMPQALSVVPAIHLPNAYGTAYGALVWRGALQTGETVMVLGAAGAVGSAAVQIARAIGARVIAVASSDAKLRYVREHGADLAVTYDAMREQALAFTAGCGVDLVIDPVGGDAFTQAIRCLAPFGRLLTVGYASGTIPQVAVNLLLVKNIAVIGHNMGLYYGWSPVDQRVQFEPKMRAMMAQLFDWTVQRKLTPTVWKSFTLDQFRQAMQAVRSREAIGKVIVAPT